MPRKPPPEFPNRQARRVAKLAETGGHRLAIVIPGDIMDRLRSIQAATGSTFNDIILTALRRIRK